MTELSSRQVIQIAAVLAVIVLGVLLRLGTHTWATFTLEWILLFTGLGVLAGARRIDKMMHAKKAEQERRQR